MCVWGGGGGGGIKGQEKVSKYNPSFKWYLIDDLKTSFYPK